MTIKRIAYFISPHGFGHATRATAVMEAALALDPDFRFDIFSTMPAWIFQDTINEHFELHYAPVDVGMVQDSSLDENPAATVARLDELLSDSSKLINSLAEELIRLNCRLAVCDIAPLGIAAAKAANIPSLLIENFTWDWIYERYLDALEEPASSRLAGYISTMRRWYAAVDWRVQTNPLCQPLPSADLRVGPISRRVKTAAREIRRRLDISPDAKLVLITMGGVPWDYQCLDRLTGDRDLFFLVPGGSRQCERKSNLILLPHQTDFHHPDLINAADAVIGKVGYSAIAEIFRAGVPFGHIARLHFRESPFLVSFIENEMNGFCVSEEQFVNGDLLTAAEKLTAMPRIRRRDPLAADQVARFICDRLISATL